MRMRGKELRLREEEKIMLERVETFVKPR